MSSKQRDPRWPPRGETTGPVVHEPVRLPEVPRRFRVHQPHGRTQDCTLHPDGRMSMAAGGQTLWSMVSFDGMREMGWATARIEWDPAPLPEPDVSVAAAVVQPPLALPAP